jgi:hypothetical protein
VGEPTDVAEAERIAWVPIAELRRLIAAGEVADGLSLSALLWVLAFDRLEPAPGANGRPAAADGADGPGPGPA